MKDLNGNELIPYPVEDAVVACCICKDAIHTTDGKQEHLGAVQDYSSVKRPISGWITSCELCRNAQACAETAEPEEEATDGGDVSGL